jgi:hypothetical protein
MPSITPQTTPSWLIMMVDARPCSVIPWRHGVSSPALRVGVHAHVYQALAGLCEPGLLSGRIRWGTDRVAFVPQEAYCFPSTLVRQVRRACLTIPQCFLCHEVRIGLPPC